MELCMVEDALSWGFAGKLSHQRAAMHQTGPEELETHVAGALELAFPGISPAAPVRVPSGGRMTLLVRA